MHICVQFKISDYTLRFVSKRMHKLVLLPPTALGPALMSSSGVVGYLEPV